MSASLLRVDFFIHFIECVNECGVLVFIFQRIRASIKKKTIFVVSFHLVGDVYS